MSGIAELFNLDACPVERGDLHGVVEIIPHRGPDGSALWCQDFVGLGHRMLHTTPESLHDWRFRYQGAGFVSRLRQCGFLAKGTHVRER